MRFPVVVRPEAERDLLAARDRYDGKRVGLGDEFAAAVELAFDRLATMPFSCAARWQDVRACHLRRFPYLVHFRVLTDRVEDLAARHGSRDGSVWKSRA